MRKTEYSSDWTIHMNINWDIEIIRQKFCRQSLLLQFRDIWFSLLIVYRSKSRREWQKPALIIDLQPLHNSYFNSNAHTRKNFTYIHHKNLLLIFFILKLVCRITRWNSVNIFILCLLFFHYLCLYLFLLGNYM